MKAKNVLLIIIFLFMGLLLNAQCKISNQAFQAGEELTYDLYFKMGLLNPKAGFSTLTLEADKYEGKEALKAQLIAKSTGAAAKMFALSDTMTSYISKELVPFAFYKEAHEGGEYTKEKITYQYLDGMVTIDSQRDKNGEFRYAETVTSTGCVYDMLSVVFYARTLDYSSMKKGDSHFVEFISGKNKLNMTIEHDGFEQIKANNKAKYDCIKLVLNISDNDAFKDKKEAMKVYITNDENRMPIRIDSKLKVGSTQAILKSYKGNRYPVD